MKASPRNTLGYSTMTTTSNPSGIPALAVVAALVAATVAVAAVLVFYREHDHVVSRGSGPVSQAVSAPAVNPDDQDAKFLFLLTAQGLVRSGARDTTVHDAHRVCARLARGESEQQIVEDIVRGSPGMSVDTATTFAATAIEVYCG
jgi:hypothetical protein